MAAAVMAVHRQQAHTFAKDSQPEIRLLARLGVEGDAHAGETVKHRSRVAKDPTQPNLRQVHLVAAELLDEVGGHGHVIEPGQLGENVTTTGLDLVMLPTGTRIRLGADAEVELTGLRNPCKQINDLGSGVLKLMFRTQEDGSKIGRTGVMGIVLTGGVVRPGDPIEITLPAEPHVPMDLV